MWQKVILIHDDQYVWSISHFTMLILYTNDHNDQIHNGHHNSQSFWRVLFAKMHCERKMTWKESRCTVALLMKIVIKHSYHLYNRTIIKGSRRERIISSLFSEGNRCKKKTICLEYLLILSCLPFVSDKDNEYLMLMWQWVVIIAIPPFWGELETWEDFPWSSPARGILHLYRWLVEERMLLIIYYIL